MNAIITTLFFILGSAFANPIYKAEFIEHTDSSQYFQTTGSGVGDVVQFDNPTYDIKDKHEVGRATGTCSRNRNTDLWFCLYEINFEGNDDDLVYVMGTIWQEAKKPAAIAVVGGTGKYRGARGTAIIFHKKEFTEQDNRRYIKLEFNVEVNHYQYELGHNTPKHFNADYDESYGHPDISLVHEIIKQDHHDVGDHHDAGHDEKKEYKF